MSSRSASWWSWVVLAGAIAGLFLGVLWGERLEPGRVFEVEQQTDGEPVLTEVTP